LHTARGIVLPPECVIHHFIIPNDITSSSLTNIYYETHLKTRHIYMYMSAKNIRQRDFCLTIHDTDWYENYMKNQLLTDLTDDKVRYFVMGREICPTTNKKHIQGYIYYTNARTFSAVKKDFPTAHIEARSEKATLQQASDYCKKEKDYDEYGSLPEDKRGKVNEWKEILIDIQAGMDIIELTAKYPEASIRYSTGIKNMYELHRPKYKFSLLEKYGAFNKAQQVIMDYVEGPTHDREIFWVFDPTGGLGKSELATHLITNNKFLVFGNAKTADVAHAWNGEDVIFDFSKSQQDRINYGVIENIKDGRIFSGKYQSCVKTYKRPKVLVFANFEPDYNQMIMDRWNVYKSTLSGDLIKYSAPADY